MELILNNILKHLMMACMLFALSMAQAATSSPEMKQALQEFVAAQDLKNAWNTIASNAAKDASNGVIRGGNAALLKNKSLTEAQRDKAKKIMQDLAPKMAEEITAYHQSLDANALVMEMAETVYSKYYTVQEIRDLTAFYGSSAFKKITRLGMEAMAESRRTGEAVANILSRNESQFNVEDKRVMADFNQSATGKKQKLVGGKVRAESMQFLEEKSMQGMDSIVQKYGRILGQQLQTATGQ